MNTSLAVSKLCTRGATIVASGSALLLAAAIASTLFTTTAAKDAIEPDLCVVPPGAQPSLPAKLLTGQGTVQMPVTTRSTEAHTFYLQGLAQLHSFWAREAERSFLQAAELDPEMAMAYWGIASAAGGQHRSSWQNLRDRGSRPQLAVIKPDTNIARTLNGAAIDAKVRAREAIDRAMAMRDSVTQRERMYIEAQWARLNPKSLDPDADFIAAMRKLVAAYPDDLEAKSILGLVMLYGYEQPSKTPRTLTLEGTALLEEIVKVDPDHVGANHYLIHAYEGSASPDKGWRASEHYPRLVPNIPHALHMPGHVFIQSDRVEDAVTALTAASANELKYMNEDALYPNGHYGHNVHFLVHGLNVLGRYEESMEQVRTLLAFKEMPREFAGDNQRTVWRHGHFALVKTLVRFERWNDILSGRAFPVYDKPEQQAWTAWATGLAQSATGRADAAKASLETMQDRIAKSKGGLEPLSIAAMELEATIEARTGKRDESRTRFAEAALREASLGYTEPPAYPRPVAEGWGHVALEIREYDTADKAYSQALTIEPGSGRAYLGRARALRAMGKHSEADSMFESARRAWHYGNIDDDIQRAAMITQERQ
jgi:tetratricopeptide (TPR) repeat protein